VTMLPLWFIPGPLESRGFFGIGEAPPWNVYMSSSSRWRRCQVGPRMPFMIISDIDHLLVGVVFAENSLESSIFEMMPSLTWVG
jgi:hypothetical protein